MLNPRLLLAALVLFSSDIALGSGSETRAADHRRSHRDTKPKDRTATDAYNEGVELMRAKDFGRAQKRFEEALEKEEFAEAHNNLAYCLRKQGPKNFDRALRHYDRAVAMNPRLPEPRMYRGVLYVHLGRMDDAKSEHAALLDLNARLAEELEYVIANREEKEPEQFFGVSSKRD
jgi:Flp pilus assembly protein TadD